MADSRLGAAVWGWDPRRGAPVIGGKDAAPWRWANVGEVVVRIAVAAGGC